MPITETGCWIWMGALSKPKNHKFAYGAVMHPTTKKIVRAHRFSWEIHRGEIPAGKFVLHKCDIPLCVNPEHLYIGTSQDNANDVVKRNRRPSQNPNKVFQLVDRWGTTCKNGHPRTDENTLVYFNSFKGRNERTCKICHRMANKREFARNGKTRRSKRGYQ